MTEIRKPCPSCPWRVDQTADDIPNFSLELAENLARTSRRGVFGPQFGDPMFACHQGREGEEFPCAGWLAVEGSAHPMVRLSVLQGRISSEALRPGDDWPELHENFEQVIEKLRGDDYAEGDEYLDELLDSWRGE